MPDGQNFPHLMDSVTAYEAAAYVPPLAMILRGLDATEIDMQQPRVSVSSGFLRFLVGEMARTMNFDPMFYAAANPDVESARLAGDVATLQQHFVDQGYFERRQPCELPFDPTYYATQYEDLAQAFDPRDTEALQKHYLSHGWQEGRVAVSWQRADADRWVAAVREAESFSPLPIDGTQPTPYQTD